MERWLVERGHASSRLSAREPCWSPRTPRPPSSPERTRGQAEGRQGRGGPGRRDGWRGRLARAPASPPRHQVPARSGARRPHAPRTGVACQPWPCAPCCDRQEGQCRAARRSRIHADTARKVIALWIEAAQRADVLYLAACALKRDSAEGSGAARPGALPFTVEQVPRTGPGREAEKVTLSVTAGRSPRGAVTVDDRRRRRRRVLAWAVPGGRPAVGRAGGRAGRRPGAGRCLARGAHPGVPRRGPVGRRDRARFRQSAQRCAGRGPGNGRGSAASWTVGGWSWPGKACPARCPAHEHPEDVRDLARTLVARAAPGRCEAQLPPDFEVLKGDR